MISIKDIISRRFFWPELLIALYLFVFIVMTGSRFGPYATRIGILAVLAFGIELLRMNRLHWYLSRFVTPLYPYLGFVLFSLILLPLIPFAASRVWNNFTGFLFLAVVFSIYRMNGRAPLIEASMLGSTALIGLMSAAGMSGRARFQGFGEGSTGASLLALIIGIAIFLGVKVVFIDLWRRLDFGLKRYIAMAGCAFAMLLGAQFIMFQSGSRQGLIWLVLAGAFVGAFFFRKSLVTGFILSIPVGILGLAAGFVIFKDTTVVQRFLVIFDPTMMALDPEQSFETRAEMILRGVELFAESPIWGHGNEGFRVLSGFFTYSHNNYIELLVNYGMLGSFLFYIPFILVFTSSGIRIMKNDRPHLRSAWLWVFVGIGSMFVSNIFVPSYYMRPMLVLMGALVGYFYFIADRGMLGAVNSLIGTVDRGAPGGNAGGPPRGVWNGPIPPLAR